LIISNIVGISHKLCIMYNC